MDKGYRMNITLVESSIGWFIAGPVVIRYGPMQKDEGQAEIDLSKPEIHVGK